MFGIQRGNNNSSMTMSPRLDYGRPLQERICFFLDQNLGTDVKFIVGPGEKQEIVTAHKMILGSVSPVFFTMFFGNLDSENEVRIPDCEPEAFKALIHFIYRGKLPQLTLTDRVSELLYIAHKYNVRQVEVECCLHLIECVTYATVFDILDIAKFYDLPGLVQICWEYIQESTAEVLTHNIRDLDLESLRSILENDHLNIPELTLFQFVIQWAESELVRNEQENNSQNIRLTVAPLINLIRFPTMLPQDLADQIVPSKILSSEQIANIYNFIYASDANKRPVLEFKANHRTPLARRAPQLGTLHPDQMDVDRSLRTFHFASLISVNPAVDTSDSADDFNEIFYGVGRSRRVRGRSSRRNWNRNPA